jgi:hypothetical protein
MHPALITWYEKLESKKSSWFVNFWKVRKESEKIIITFTSDKQKSPDFAVVITEVTNPLKINQSTFMFNCWTAEFQWMHAIVTSDLSHAEWELDKFMKLLIIGRAWFADENKTSLPREIKATSVLWLANNKENIGLSGFAHLIKNNMQA